MNSEDLSVWHCLGMHDVCFSLNVVRLRQKMLRTRLQACFSILSYPFVSTPAFGPCNSQGLADRYRGLTLDGLCFFFYDSLIKPMANFGIHWHHLAPIFFAKHRLISPPLRGRFHGLASDPGRPLAHRSQDDLLIRWAWLKMMCQANPAWVFQQHGYFNTDPLHHMAKKTRLWGISPLQRWWILRLCHSWAFTYLNLVPTGVGRLGHPI